MSLKFTALEVDEGDAFLIENDDTRKNEKKIILFDSGINDKIVSLLNNKSIKKIDIAICSHNDNDHAKGFIALLQSNSPIKIKEIWLPWSWASIIDYINNRIIQWDKVKKALIPKSNKKKEDIDNHVFSEEELNEIENNIYKWHQDNYEILRTMIEESNKEDEDEEYKDKNENDFLSAFTKNSYEKIDDFNRKLGLLSDLMTYPNNCCIHGFHHIHRLSPKIKIKLYNIMAIAILAYKANCNIRWFEYSNNIGRPINLNLIIPNLKLTPLNSKEIKRVKKIKTSSNIFPVLFLSKENEYSLVFELLKKNITLVRFSADSNCTCQSVPYINNIIITAPHHGSKANKNVYGSFSGNNIIWVRSDTRNSKRPCNDYIALSKKYCTICNNTNSLASIEFKYDVYKHKWNYIKGNICICK